MITIELPDGRRINVNTDDPEKARKAGIAYYKKTRALTAEDLEESEISTVGDIAKGLVGGPIKAVAGLSSLPWEVYDALADPEESQAQKVRDFYDSLTPTTRTKAGEAASFITQFAIPGTIAARIAKARKLGKAGEIGALAGTDFAVATQDVETLGDFFETGPTQTTDTEALEGTERAAAELGNRLKVAGESAAIILGLPMALSGAAKGIGKGLEAAGETGVGKSIASTLTDPESIVGSTMTKIGESAPGKIYKKWFTFAGDLPDKMSAQIKAQRVHEMSSINNELSRNMNVIDKSLNALSKSGTMNSVDDRTALNAINDFMFNPDASARLSGEKTLKELDKKLESLSKESLFKPELSLFDAASRARNQIDGLSARLSRDDGLLDPESQQSLIDIIDGNMKFYGTRMYRALKDPSYVPTQEQTKNAIDELVRMSAQSDSPLSPQEALNVLNDMMSKKNFSSGGMKPNMQFEEETLKGMANGILKGRRLDNLPALRDFLGEYTGNAEILRFPGGASKQENVLRKLSYGEQKEGLLTKVKETTEGVAKIITKNNMFKDIDRYNTKLGEINPSAQFIFDEVPLTGTPGEYVRLGELDASGIVTDASKARFGPLAGKYIKAEYQNGFENAADILKGDSLLSNLWSTFLGLKGVSQLSKTVYSPTTQIRNATTAAFFAAQNGNVGKGQTLLDSMQTVFSEIGGKYIPVKGAKSLDKTRVRELYDEYTQLGVVNTNVRQGEFEQLIKEAIDNKTSSRFFQGAPLKAAEKLQNNFATKVYQGSDDVWKIYSYEMELGKLKDIIKKNPNASIPTTDYRNLLEFGENVNLASLDPAQAQIFLKREAASIVKDTVPNYVRVPKAILALRKLPFGNFIAFPAEIIRTSGNTLGRAIKEISSESPELRSIGMKRLAGVATVNYIGGRALSSMGHALTGSTEEQTEAYKRSFAPEWERNSQLIPVATDKNGNVTEFYNYSYTNPYDYLTRPVRAVFNAVNNGITEEKELSAIAMDAATESASEFFDPFVSETIIGEKLLDLGRNTTTTGRQIWNTSDPFGDKLAKGFGHVAEAVLPPIVPFDFRKGELELKDLPKAALYSVGMQDSAVSRSGARLDPAGEFAEALSGVKTVRPMMENQLYYRGIEAADDIREAGRIFTQVAKKRNKVEAQEITDAYIKSNEQRFKGLRSLNMAIDDARTLGMTDAQIARTLKRAKAPDYKRVMSGFFTPYKPSKQIIKEAYRADRNKLANPFDFEAINQVRAEQLGRKLRPEAMAAQQAAQQAPVAPPPAPPPMPQIDAEPAEPPSLFQRGVDALRQVELDKLFGNP